MSNSNPDTATPLTRRHFISTTSTVLAGGSLLPALSVERNACAAGGDQLKIALVGCGGRGSGAANQALQTAGDVKLVAMAEIFQDRVETALKNLRVQNAERVDVPPERQFVGFDAYKKAIALADVVILATPPAFRPLHFEEAVRQGKHVFMEKPVAVDAPGIRRVLAAAAEAKKKNLKVAVGFQRRHKPGYREMIQRLRDGAIGEITFARAYTDTPTRAGLVRPAGLSELEYQFRNWYYFTWLSGDVIVDNLVHGLDVMNWIKDSHPIRAQGLGGMQIRRPEYGTVFDHHAVEYEYADGTRLFAQCHRIVGCWANVSEHIHGTKGAADLMDSRNLFTITGAHAWQFQPKPVDPYQQEHDHFFAAIRNDTAYNEAERGATSTMTAILGRMATYSGKMMEWDAALDSQLELAPPATRWDTAPPVLPDPSGLYPVALPGTTITA